MVDLSKYHMDAEPIARAFHEAYEGLAPFHGYATREASAKPWEEVPDQNKELMVATVDQLLRAKIIRRTEPVRLTNMPKQVAYPATQDVEIGDKL